LITGPHHRLRARVAPDACVLPVGRSSSLHRRPLPGLAGCDRAKYICSSCSVHLLPGNGQCFILLPFVCRISAGSRNSSSFKYEDGRAHDRLLGRLLSLDFDPTTCLSRYEKSKRWKPSPFPVSSYLVEKLRQYEANHQRCGPDTANYREAMAQLMSGRNADHGEGKYVVWFPVEGLGNRMLSVVSTFLYALLLITLTHDTLVYLNS
jgi:hypothetical protein